MELDDLLEESISLREKIKKVNSGIKPSEHSDLSYMLEDFWKTTFIGALFVKERCACGQETIRFSHYFAYQDFISSKLSKPRRMVRLSERPELGTVKGSYFIEQPQLGCACCVECGVIIPLSKETIK